MKRLFLPMTTILLVLAGCASHHSWEAALQGEHRSQEHVARDQYRHPKETLQFFGVKPSSTVVEIWPGAGWYTEILAPLLRSDGKLYAAHFPADAQREYFRQSRSQFENKLSNNPEVYDRVILTNLMPPEHIKIAPENSADFVLSFRSVHGWLRSDNAPAVMDSIYAALKPGGVFGVVQHRGDPNLSMEQMKATAYVPEATVKSLAKSVGFEFLASSEINANPKDTKDYEKGVWTLPPSLRLGQQDREKYLQIGESDRMTLKFRKPNNP